MSEEIVRAEIVKLLPLNYAEVCLCVDQLDRRSELSLSLSLVIPLLYMVFGKAFALSRRDSRKWRVQFLSRLSLDQRMPPWRDNGRSTAICPPLSPSNPYFLIRRENTVKSLPTP